MNKGAVISGLGLLAFFGLLLSADGNTPKKASKPSKPKEKIKKVVL